MPAKISRYPINRLSIIADDHAIFTASVYPLKAIAFNPPFTKRTDNPFTEQSIVPIIACFYLQTDLHETRNVVFFSKQNRLEELYRVYWSKQGRVNE